MCQSPQAAAAALINNTVAEQRMPPSSLVLEEVLLSFRVFSAVWMLWFVLDRTNQS